MPPVKSIQYREKNTIINNRYPIIVIHPSVIHILHCAFPKTANTQALNKKLPSKQVYKKLPAP